MVTLMYDVMLHLRRVAVLQLWQARHTWLHSLQICEQHRCPSN